MEISEVALLLSAFALIVAIASLWVNSLTPFSLKVTHDAPTFAAYKITPNISGSEKGKIWWIPSFDIGFSFLNTGRRPGEILDIRIIAEHTDSQPNKRYVFYPEWLVDYSRFNKDSTERFKWLDEAVIRDWYSISLGGHKDVHVHLILELMGERWDEKLNGNFECTLQYISTQKEEWIVLGEYNLLLMDDLFEENCTYVATDKNIEKIRKL